MKLFAGILGLLFSLTAWGRLPRDTDDGRGNVATLVNAANGQMVAAYDYDPFCELLRACGPLARDSHFHHHD